MIAFAHGLLPRDEMWFTIVNHVVLPLPLDFLGIGELEVPWLDVI